MKKCQQLIEQYKPLKHLYKAVFKKMLVMHIFKIIYAYYMYNILTFSYLILIQCINKLIDQKIIKLITKTKAYKYLFLKFNSRTMKIYHMKF